MLPRSRMLAPLALLAAAILALPAWAQAPPRTIPGELLVKFKPTASAAERASVMGQMHGRALRSFDFIGVEHWKLEGTTVEQALSRLRNHPRIEYAEPNYELRADLVPNDPRFPEMYGLRNTGQTGGTPGADIKAVNAWDLFTGDPNLLVGVIDTGFDYNHPDLAANVWTNPGEIPGNGIDDDHNGYVDDVHGYDFYNNDGDPFDDNGHGTHTSGTIAAVGNNNVGVVGVCWQAKIVGIKFLSAGGSGSTAGAIAGVQYAIAVGVRLTSNSWGGGGFSQALLDAINAAGAAGQLFVAAAGNSSQNTDVTPNYPSAYNSPYIIAVAATDHNDNLASFSNYGATTVDIAAPGVSILSTQPGNSYQLLSGTSMATPHVAGAAAMVMGRFPGISNLQAKTLILNAADVKPQLAGKCLTGGRLNLFLSIAEPDDTPPGMIGDLATSNPGSNTMGLQWTATGDDGATGRASRYEIRYSTAPIDAGNFGSATPVAGPDPHPAGSAESFEVGGLSFSTLYYFAIKAFDEFNNAGPISNVPTGTTLGIPNIAAAPGSFSSTLLTGATDTQTLTLSNTGEGTLDFTVPTPDLIFTQPVVHPYQPTPKGQADVRIGDPVAQGHGGPDGFGYRWVDSNEPGDPAFSWVDITGVGALLTLTGDDATSAPVPIGFSFPYYGGSFSDVRVCTNGFLSLSDASAAYENQALPNAGAPANLVAPFWDDLDFGAAQRVYTHNDGTSFVVAWVGVPHYGGGGPYTFETILYPTGEIRFQYLSMGSPTNSATAGIQNGTKTVGLTVAFNTDYVANNLAVRIVPLSQWLTVSPASGRIPAGQSQNLSVMFNALGLDGGDYDASLNVLSNDPDGSPLVLPAHLHVNGAPDVAVNPSALDFGSFFAGGSATRTLTISNPGTAPLVVSSIGFGAPDLTADASSFTLAPRAARNVLVTWSPPAPATLSSMLTINSDDPDEPAKTVPLTGEATPAPSFSVSPEQLDVALLTNTATSRNLRISNSGGSNYVFAAEAQAFTPSGTVVQHTEADNVDLEKGASDVQFGPAPLRAGGPDVFGYAYQDSDEPGGPTFGWVDIRAVGTQVNMTGDDVNTGPYPIGFSFPFYGQTFTTFRVCTNGFVSFTSTLTTFGNTSLPNSGSTVPPNLLAAFWDDLDFQTVKRAYYYNDGTKLVIQFQDVTRHAELSPTHPNTFEILLFPNGTVVYQYLSMTATTKNSATIGIQNEAKNDGLQVVFNALYVKNNLAIRFRPPAKFLTVTPTSGTVAPGSFLDLTVGFNAAGLFGGLYDGQVHIAGNDPVLPQKDVPCALTVTGVPDIATSPASLDFGNVFIGFPQLRQLAVSNVGTDNLVVDNVTLSDPAYGVDQSSFTVPPLGNAVLTLSFNPAAATSYPGTLTLVSNDPDTPSKTVALTGSGLLPPDIGASPSSIATTLPIPGTEDRTLTLSNSGGSDLTFVVGTNLTASSVAVYDALALGKEESDPRPGILGSGGPDVFGYTWRDSDEPGGPVF
ncbi:MAG TPA: S8 family serine peptidase, partial [Candidatus Eisenbacteria bacterium]